MEGEEEMNRFTEEQTEKLVKVGIGYIAWVIASVTGWFLLPAEWQWVCYGPVLFIILAVVLTCIIIIARPILPKPITRVYVGRKRVTCCHNCPMVEIKENPVNINFPIVKCREMAKVCYQPMKIPRWCPYAD
jgi:hypothetical protein